MFTHILVPTDGSPLSLKAARAGAELASKLGAKLTAVYVIPTFVPGYAGDALYFANLSYEKEYLQGMEAQGEKALAKVATAAAKAGIQAASTTIVSPSPWEGIIQAAAKLKCDTIVMSSHGRGGLAGVVLGSQTNRVLVHSTIPVMVCR